MNRQTTLKAILEGGSAKAKPPGPFSQAQSLSIMGQHDIATPVSLLFFPRRPAAVARFIVAIVVDAVNRVVSTRGWPYVGKECLEGVNPPLAHANSTPAVVVVTGDVGVTAPDQHGSSRSPSLLDRVEAMSCSADSNSLCECGFDTHAASDAGANRGILDADDARPLGNSLCLAIPAEVDIASAVVGLGSSGCPANVSRFVTSIVVDSVQGVRRGWGDSNIGEEEVKRLQPAVADGDSASAVVGEFLGFGVVASLLNTTPHSVLFCLAATMLQIADVPTFMRKAPATSDVPATDAMCDSVDDIATRASKLPNDPLVGVFDEADRRKPVVLLARFDAEFISPKLSQPLDANAATAFDFTRHDMGCAFYGQFATGATELPEKMSTATLPSRFYGHKATKLVA